MFFKHLYSQFKTRKLYWKDFSRRKDLDRKKIVGFEEWVFFVVFFYILDKDTLPKDYHYLIIPRFLPQKELLPEKKENW